MSYLSRKVRFSRNNRHHSNKQNWENIHIFLFKGFSKRTTDLRFLKLKRVYKWVKNSYSKRGSYYSNSCLNFMRWETFWIKIHKIWSISRAAHWKISDQSKIQSNFSSLRTWTNLNKTFASKLSIDHNGYMYEHEKIASVECNLSKFVLHSVYVK